MDLDQEIQETEKKLKELKERKKARGIIKPDEKIVAESIHSLVCHRDHTEDCPWFYESWEEPGYARTKYLGKARLLLKGGYTLDRISGLLKVLGG